MPGKADKAKLARLPGFEDGFHGPADSKNTVRIGIANHFMELG